MKGKTVMEQTAQSLRVSESRIRMPVQSETPAELRKSDMRSEQQRLSKLGILANVFMSEPTGPVLDMYLQALEDLTDEQFTLAIGLAIKSLKFFPKPAELRELVGADGSSLDQKSESHKAWDVLLSFVSKWVQSNVEGTYTISRGVRSS